MAIKHFVTGGKALGLREVSFNSEKDKRLGKMPRIKKYRAGLLPYSVK
jgi:hypothetical protein